YGISEGSPSMASIERTASQALIEVTMALNNGSTSSDLEFGAIGHSIGCAAALRLATALQTTTPLRHVALCAPFTSLPEVAKVLLPILKGQHGGGEPPRAEPSEGPARRRNPWHARRDLPPGPRRRTGGADEEPAAGLDVQALRGRHGASRRATTTFWAPRLSQSGWRRRCTWPMHDAQRASSAAQLASEEDI
ncbi:unnamed protein product, partial [Prorocentrum cordatum]